MLVLSDTENLLKNKSKKYVTGIKTAFISNNHGELMRFANYCVNSNEPMLAIQSLIILLLNDKFKRFYRLRNFFI